MWNDKLESTDQISYGRPVYSLIWIALNDLYTVNFINIFALKFSINLSGVVYFQLNAIQVHGLIPRL